MISLVWAAMNPSVVVGEDGTNGGLWCSPVANTSRPTCSACRASSTVFVMRSCSLMVVPVVGSWVRSPTVKIPNCIVPAPCLDSFNFNYRNGSRRSFIPRTGVGFG